MVLSCPCWQAGPRRHGLKNIEEESAAATSSDGNWPQQTAGRVKMRQLAIYSATSAHDSVDFGQADPAYSRACSRPARGCGSLHAITTQESLPARSRIRNMMEIRVCDAPDCGECAEQDRRESSKAGCTSSMKRCAKYELVAMGGLEPPTSAL